MKRRGLAVLLLTMVTATALAADVAGKWTGSGKGMTLTFTFKRDAAKLTGMVRASTGETAAIEEGSIEGDNLSFTVYLDQDRSTRFRITGVAIGDEIKLTQLPHF